MSVQAQAPRAIRIAVLAMGGEGGGVLANWLVDLAEHEGWTAQTTSIPGVAQRTGATTYYVEIFPPAERMPVPALMPTPGDVDLVIASELMEAGRAIQRGLVTPDRTTLVTSLHRVYSMTERTALGDGRVDAVELGKAARSEARRLVSADFEKIAEDARSVIGAALFGAVAGSGALPFQREQFEAAVKRGGIGVDSSLRAFAAGFAAAGEKAGDGGVSPALAQTSAAAPAGLLAPLSARIRQDFPAALHDLLFVAIVRLAEFQDVDYASAYLDRLEPFIGLGDGRLLAQALRHLEVWMAYDDGIKVAQEKIRAVRFDAVARDVRLGGDQLLTIREFLHPRVEEVADIMPAWLGRRLLTWSWARSLFGMPRTLTSTSLAGFVSLWLLVCLRPLRRSSLRFQREDVQIHDWLGQLNALAADDYELAVAFADLPRLIKGYGDTHVRGQRNFSVLLDALPAVRRRQAPAQDLAGLIAAALADEDGSALNAALWGLAPNSRA